MKILLGAFLLGVVASAIDPECQPTPLETYDFIVVGGGTAGSAAAAELARSLPDNTVLLLDQGKDFSDQAIVMDNDQFANIQQTPYCEHKFSTETALGSGPVSSDRNIYTCVSKILGGASSLNYGGWYRLPEHDLNAWVEATGGDESWSYDSLLPYFKRLEAVERDEGSTPNPDRGYDGLIPVRHDNISVVHYHTGMIPAIETYLGVPVGDQDSNNRNQDAIGTLQESRVANGCWYDDEGNEMCAANLRNGSSYNAFIREPQRKGELQNLHILEGAKVVQVYDFLPENMDGPMMVEYVYKSYRYRMYAKEEILLSAGSWANPKIALLSGIGNMTELSEVGIESKIDLPGVGRGLQDHGTLWLTAMLRNIQVANISDLAETEGLGFDPNTFSGINNPLPALLGGRNTINLFFKSNENLEYPNMEFLTGLAPTGFNSALVLLRIYQNIGTAGSIGGFLKLRSDDPNEEMDTSRNWYADDESIQPMMESLKTVIEMINVGMASSDPMILEPNAFTVDFTDDEALKSYIRANVVSEMHLQCSMKMGDPTTDPLAVLNNELQVVGTNGRLRVADTSSFPTEVRGHPMAAAMVVGMKAATLISDSYTARKLETETGGDEGTNEENGSPEDTSGNGNQCAYAVAAAATTCAFAVIEGL